MGTGRRTSWTRSHAWLPTVTAGALWLGLAARCESPSVMEDDIAASQGASTYYVSPEGNDKSDGLSPSSAWRSLKRADQVRFKPGDRLRLKGGSRFTGGLSIGPEEAGSAKHPVLIDSYGAGRATIAADDNEAIAVHNTAGVEIRNLTLVGNSKGKDENDGISFITDRPAKTKPAHVRISSVDVSGFRNGVIIGANRRGGGFRDVRISDTDVHHNVEAGLVTYGTDFDATRPDYAHEEFSVERVRAFRNSGNPWVHDRNTGSGIILGDVRSAVIRGCSSYSNGEHSSALAVEGPEGIWTHDSTDVTIEKNVAYDNRTGSQADGNGFGLDNNVTSSVLQYNLSFGNDGAGFLLYSGHKTRGHENNTVRFNMSNGDARKFPSYGGIVVHGLAAIRDVRIYHNTVVMRGTGAESAPALRLQQDLDRVVAQNNLFMTDGAAVVAAQESYDTRQVLLQGNNYFSSGRWQLAWGAQHYADLPTWRTAQGQEQISDRATGGSDDPCVPALVDPVSDAAEAHRLVPGCPGNLAEPLDLVRVGIDPGPVDFFGTPLWGSVPVGAGQGRVES